MDVFFNPSVTETFGNVTLEAMAAGVPVVARRAIGAIGMVDDGETGFLVAPRDIAGYADAIERLVARRPAHRATGAAGHAKAAATMGRGQRGGARRLSGDSLASPG